MALDKILHVLGYGLAIDVAARLYFGSNIGRNVIRPMLKRIEGNDAHRIVELARHEIADGGFEIGSLDLGLAVDDAICAKAIETR